VSPGTDPAPDCATGLTIPSGAGSLKTVAMMNVRQSRSRRLFALRSCAFALALCVAGAPIGMSCCTSFPCSASQPNGNSDLPCHGPSGPHSHHPSSAAPDLYACHAGEFALEALRQESGSGKAHEMRGYSSGVDSLSSSHASLLDAGSCSSPARTCAISPHLENQPSPHPLLRI